MKHLIFLFSVLVLTTNFTFLNADTRSGNNELYPSSWDIELKEAKISGDKQKEAMLEQMIYEKTQHMITVPDMNDVDVFTRNVSPVYQPDWLADDVLVYAGDLGASGSGHRRMDMKMGKDGNLYSVALGRPDANYNGIMKFMKSTDGGLTWTNIGTIESPSAYFGQVSLVVANRTTEGNPLIADSTRLIAFYSRSLNSNFDDATINWITFRSNGTGEYGGIAAITPTAGNKLLYPSGISDAQYYNSATYFGVVCVEYQNGTELTKFLRYARTTNWGNSYNSVSIEDGYVPDRTDHHPVGAFKKGFTIVTDSVYIVTQRKVGANSAILKFAIKFTPPSGIFSSTILTPFQGYKLPCITIVQTASLLWENKQIMIGYINEAAGVNNAAYEYSSNSGSSWTSYNVNNPNTEFPTYVSVSSDSNRLDGGYLTFAYQKGNGDTIVTMRGEPGNLTDYNYKVNQFRSSPFNSPVVAIYRNGTEKYSALVYSGLSAGNWTSNIYFDSENLVSSVTNTSTIAESYNLEQNFPNPFNPSTTIKFSIPSASLVKLAVFDITGREVATLVNEQLSSGTFEYDFNATNLTSGVYFYKLTTNDFSEVKRMMLVK